jgi:hypothetical protein
MKKRVRSGKNSCFKKSLWQADADEALSEIRAQNSLSKRVQYASQWHSLPAERSRVEYPFLSYLLKERLYDDHLDRKGQFSPNLERAETRYDPNIVEKRCTEIVNSCKLSSLTTRCIEVVAENLDRYESNYVRDVLFLLPSEHTTALSSVACKLGTINDDNITCFIHSNSEFLVLGGEMLTDFGIQKVFPQVTSIPNEDSVVESWEELDDSEDEVCNTFSVSGCMNLQRIFILSPRITMSVLYQLAKLPISKVKRLDLYGKCSLPVVQSDNSSEVQTFDMSSLREIPHDTAGVTSIF